MTRLKEEFIAQALGFLATLLTPGLLRWIVSVSQRYSDSSIPRVAGAWTVRFNEPTGRRGVVARAIDAELQQCGRYIHGRGHLQGNGGDPFRYQGMIKRNVLYGTFQRLDSHVLAGTGTFVLRISADSNTFVGQCTWYDNHLDNVWSSEYRWIRNK